MNLEEFKAIMAKIVGLDMPDDIRADIEKDLENAMDYVDTLNTNMQQPDEEMESLKSDLTTAKAETESWKQRYTARWLGTDTDSGYHVLEENEETDVDPSGTKKYEDIIKPYTESEEK